MILKLPLIARSLNRSITPRLRKLQSHRLIKQIETLYLIDRLLRAFYAVENDESLAFGFEVCLCDDVNDFAVFGEEFCESFFELLDLDALFEVADVDSMKYGERLVDGKGRGAGVRVGVQ
jgi:hypothetical protein